MPRTARVVIDGGTYHILTRGNNGQTVFHHDIDFQRYLQYLSTCSRKHNLKLYHFTLMPNHVHLVLEVAVGEALSKAMLSLNLTYALWYRRRYRYTGHLWQGRFKNLLIDRDSYLLECGRYVELNPVRAGLVRDPAAYAWSSYRVYAEGADNPLLSPNPLYETLGLTLSERRERYRQFIAEGIREVAKPVVSRITSSGRMPPNSWPGHRFGFSGPRGKLGRPRKLELGAENRNVPIFNRASHEK